MINDLKIFLCRSVLIHSWSIVFLDEQYTAKNAQFFKIFPVITRKQYYRLKLLTYLSGIFSGNNWKASSKFQ